MTYDDKTEPYPTVVVQYFEVYARLVPISRTSPEYAVLERQLRALWDHMNANEKRQVGVAEGAP